MDYALIMCINLQNRLETYKRFISECVNILNPTGSLLYLLQKAISITNNSNPPDTYNQTYICSGLRVLFLFETWCK